MERIHINAYLPAKTVQALDIWKEATGLSRNQTISLAVSFYLMQKTEFRLNAKARELLKDEIEIFEKSNN